MTQNILFIINDWTDISLNQFILKISNFLTNKNYSNLIISLNSNGKLRSDFKKNNNLQTITLNKNFFSTILSTIKLIKKHNIKLIHTQTLRADYLVFLSKPFIKHKLIHISNRRNYFFLLNSPINLFKNIAYFLSCHLTNYNLCVAKHLKIKLIDKLNVKPSKVTYIPNGVKIPKQPSSLNSQPTTILFTGRLIKRKNLIYLLKALSLINHNFKFLILGQGPQQQKLQQFINHHQLNNKVKLLGHKTNINPYLKTTSIFITPSKNEAQSWSILEAMSFGATCLVSDIAANKELIQHHKTGLVFSLKDNQKQLINQLNQILTNSKLKHSLGTNARKFVQTHHSQSQMFKKYLKTYLLLLSH